MTTNSQSSVPGAAFPGTQGVHTESESHGNQKVKATAILLRMDNVTAIAYVNDVINMEVVHNLLYTFFGGRGRSSAFRGGGGS